MRMAHEKTTKCRVLREDWWMYTLAGERRMYETATDPQNPVRFIDEVIQF